MKSAKILLVLLALFLIPFVIATITNTINVPADNYKSNSNSVLFNWTPSTDGTVTTFPSELYISDANNESLFILNQTILYCTNNTDCTKTVTGFPNGYFQWIVQTGEAATQPSITGTNAATFDTLDRSANITGTVVETYDTSDRAANITSTNAEPFNTLDRAAVIISTNGISYNTSENDTIDVTYTNGSGVTETCNVTLENSHTLPVANVTSAFNTACNFTASGTGNFTLTTDSTGVNEFIIIDSGNATNVLGLTTGTNYSGSINNTLNIRYTNNTVEEICNVTLTKSAGLATSDVIANITQASVSCNITTTDVANVNVNSVLTGANEWIIFETGTANSIIGFTTDLNFTGSSNNTLGINYTVAGATNTCVATLSKSSTLTAEEAVNNITSVCDLQGPNETVSYVNLNTNSTGVNEFIYFTNGSALGLLGFVNDTNYTGTANNTVNLAYTVNGTTESCAVSLTKNVTLLASEAVSNFTQASASCNLTVSNTTVLILTGSGYGTGEFVNITGGNAVGILGLSGIDYGTQTESNTTARYLQIQDSTPGSNDSTTRWLNDSGFLAMTLVKDTGNLWIAGIFNSTGNLTIGDKITFTLGQIIDATVAGVLRITTPLRVDGDIRLNETGTAYNITGLSCIKWDNGAEDCGI